jgi:hypothetical protein
MTDALKFAPFEGVDADLVLAKLALVSKENTTNGKMFWISFKSWEKMNVDQRSKTLTFWESNITETTRNKILDECRTAISQEAVAEKERQAITTKNDKARILHLRVDPAAAADWTAALREKNRPELDASKNCPDADPWNRLAEKFNNYNLYRYSNLSLHGNGGLTSLGIPLSAPGMEAISRFCHDINPSAPNRPIRDGYWLRLQYRDLKGKISQCFLNYRKSGNQDAENVYDEWVKYSTSFSNDAVTYARAVLSDDDIDRLGRALPEAIQRDTGILPSE